MVPEATATVASDVKSGELGGGDNFTTARVRQNSTDDDYLDRGFVGCVTSDSVWSGWSMLQTRLAVVYPQFGNAQHSILPAVAEVTGMWFQTF